MNILKIYYIFIINKCYIDITLNSDKILKSKGYGGREAIAQKKPGNIVNCFACGANFLDKMEKEKLKKSVNCPSL